MGTSGSSASSSATSSPAARPGSTRSCKWRPSAVVSRGQPGSVPWRAGMGIGDGNRGRRVGSAESHVLSPALLRAWSLRTPASGPCAEGGLAAAACGRPASFPLWLAGTCSRGRVGRRYQARQNSFCSAATCEGVVLHYLSRSLRACDSLPAFLPELCGMWSLSVSGGEADFTGSALKSGGGGLRHHLLLRRPECGGIGEGGDKGRRPFIS